MSETVPDGPTDPRFSPVEDNNTTIVTPGYGPPPGSPAAPFSSPLAPPTIPAPPGPVGSPIPPVTEEPMSGRVYGETRAEPARPPAADRIPELAERGKTTVADDVVERIIGKIVDIAVAEIAGVHGLYTDPEIDKPVTVELDGENATIGISIQVEFGHTVQEVVEKVRASVISQAERLLGMKVAEVNVHVGDVAFESAEE